MIIADSFDLFIITYYNKIFLYIHLKPYILFDFSCIIDIFLKIILSGHWERFTFYMCNETSIYFNEVLWGIKKNSIIEEFELTHD